MSLSDKLKQYNEQAANPAAPVGAQQAAQAAAGVTRGDAGSLTSKLGQWITDPDVGYVGAAQSWFSGANQNGPLNGWSTPFVDSYFKQVDESVEAGTFDSLYDREDFTGLVTYNRDATEVGGRKVEYGDIYENGELKGNVYSLYDQDTANLMMSTFTLDAKEKKQAYKDAAFEAPKDGSLRNPELDRVLQAKRQTTEQQAAAALGARAFEQGVDEKAADYQEGMVDEATVAGGALGGAAVGAGVGSVVPVVGTTAGAVVGGAIGGLGAWLNKDSLTEQAARASEITALSREQFGLDAAVATGVGQWSKFGMRMISPTSNLVQGAVDAYGKSEIGDGEADFYRMDRATGERTVSKWAIGADVAASVADGLLQFASPLGLAAYSANMSGAVGGQVAELGLTGGSRFDDRRGGFDNVFFDTDADGNRTFDPASAAAGIGSIGIDAVQLGFARGLAGKVDSVRSLVGRDAVYAGRTTAAADAVARNTVGRLPKWMGGQSDKAALRNAGDTREVRIGGFAYTIDDATGTAISRRGTLSLLAPSEALSSISVGAMARRAAARKDGALSTDDIYRAATALASGERKLTTAMVNAFGEGGEELAQSALEPISHDANLDAQEMYLAAAYGFAGGLGMGLAANVHTPNTRAVLEAQARVAHEMLTGGAPMDDAQLKRMSDSDLRLLAGQMSSAQREVAKTAYRKAVDSLTASQTAGTAGLNKLMDAIRTARDAELAAASPRTDGAFVITPLEATGIVDADGNMDYSPDPATGLPRTSVRSDAIASSAGQLLANMANRRRGMDVQVEGLERELERLTAAGDAELAEQIARVTRDLGQAQLSREWMDRIMPDVTAAVAQIRDEADPAARAAHVAVLNDQLRAWFDGTDTDFRGEALDDAARRAIARAVTQVWARDPHDSSGSYPALVPQVSLQLAVSDADNVLQISSGVLKAIRGDHDGDKLRPMNQLWLDDDAFDNARSGQWFIGTGTTVHVDPPKQEKYTVEAIALAHKRSADNPTLAAEATAALVRIGTAIKRRYGGRGVDVPLDRVLERFYDAVRANTKDARAVLLDGLASDLGSVVNEVGREKLANEWLWVDQVVRSNFQEFQDVYVAHQALPAREAADLNITPEEIKREAKRLHRSTRVKETRTRRGATFGATMGLLLTGDSPFRMFQKLHYSSLNSSVLTDAGMEQMELWEMAEAYERLGQNLTQPELDRIRGVDEITGQVLVALERMASDAAGLTAAAAQNPDLTEAISGLRGLAKHEALVVIANTAVRDFNYDPATDTYTPGGTISMAQMLLKLAVQRDAEQKREILASSPTLQAKHARLLSLTVPGGGRNGNPVNAEKAFMEVFGAQQLGALLGPEADVFGSQLTLEQFLRMYVHMSEEDRQLKKTELTVNNPAYLGRARPKNIPYTIEEMLETDDGKAIITPTRSVVDSILAVGNARITADDQGNIIGELADRSHRVSQEFVEAHRSVRAVMARMLDLDPKNDELTSELVQRIITQNPDFARKVMELIPNSAAQVVFEVRGDEVYVNNWFYEMFTTADGKKAEMVYWRAVLLETWRAAGARTDEADRSGLEYDRLARRMHRVMYRVAKAGDGGVLEKTFLDALWSHENVDDFIAWVNRTPGLRANEAPLVPWIDDVAEFDVDKANGGWTTSLAGAELREAIKTLKQSSTALLDDVIEEQALLEADIRYLSAIDRAAAKKRGEVVPGHSTEDDRVYAALAEAIDTAAETAVSLGPHAMVFQSTANAWGFYGQAHNKGKNPAHVEAYGMFDARRDAFGFVHNYSRVMGALTAYDLDAVGSNLDMVAKDGGRTMDDYGRVVEWGKPTPEQMAALLRDPATRSFARALIQPTVLERTEEGGLSEQLLLGKSLEELLEGKAYQELYAQYDRLSQESAFKYLSLLDAGARRFGGHMSVSRAVNDIVIARINAARQTLSFEDVESMVTETYYEVAQLLQQVGSLAAREKVEGTDTLSEMLVTLKKERRERAAAARRGIFGQDRLATGVDTSEVQLDLFLGEMKQQLAEDLKGITAAIDANPGREQELLAQADRLQAEFDLFEQRLEQLKVDDEVAPIVAAFTIPAKDPAMFQWAHDRQVAGVRRAIVQFIDMNPSIRQRVPEVLPLVMKVQHQLSDPEKYGEVDLAERDWDALSRAVIGMLLTDSAGPVAASVSVRLYPDAKTEADRRYYDTSFSYLLDPLLDPTGPLVQAAARMHVQAKRHEVTAMEKDIRFQVERGVFDEKRLGPWTEEVVIASVEANQRIDSAAAAQAVAISGQSPKLEATVSSATERTFVVPGDELLSTVALTARQLELTQFDEVDVVFPGGVTEARPLAQLNNRFARAVVMRGEGLPAEGIDLLAENPDLGRTWYGNAAAANSGLVEIHPDRIAEALAASAARHNVKPGAVTVEVAFFHPESQPATPEFYNNLWFEGTSFKLDADRHPSLNETLWFSLGSLSPEGQAAALDAAKSGKQAMQVIQAPTAAQRAAAETGWDADLAGVLRRKTRLIMETDLGFGALDPEFYNAVFKGQKLRHFVLADGEVFTAEQAIEMQRAGHVFVDAQLWTPSDKVLRSMLGELGDQGVPRAFDTPVDYDTFRVPPYRGVSADMLRWFEAGLSGETAELADTRIVHRPRQSTLTVRPVLPRKQRDQWAQRFRKMVARRDDGYVERATMRQGGEGRFDVKANLNAAITAAGRMLQAENLAFMYDALGIHFVGPRNPGDLVTSTMVLNDVAAQIASDGRRTGWILRNNAPGDTLVDGVLGQVPLEGNERPGMRILLGDLVVVEVDTFGDDAKKAKQQMDLLAEKGATIVFGDLSGGSDLMGELAAYVRSLGYESIAGSKHAYRPRESNSVYVAKAARESTLVAVDAVSPRGRSVVLNVVGLPMQEGGAFLNPRAAANRGAIKVVSDLVPTSSMGGFGVPRRELRDDDQHDRVVRHLRGLDNPLGLAMLQEMSHGKLDGEARQRADESFARAWTRMIERFEDPDNGVLPAAGDTFEIGDMIPLVDGNGSVVLYRHGHKRPDLTARKEMFRKSYPGRGPAGANVAVYSNEIEPAATTHSGTVVEFKPRAGYGLSVELEVPLQMFGNKEQIQWDGTKYTIVPWPDEREPGAPILPQHTFLRNRDIDLVSDLDTRLGKQGTESMVNSHREAFAFFGIDFLPDAAQFFFGDTGFEAQQATREILDAVARFGDKITVAQAHQLLRSPQLDTAFAAVLPDLTSTLAADGIDVSWANRLGDDDVAAQITSAMLVYLSTPGARPEDVLHSGSFDDVETGPDSQSRRMPSLFTQVFDDAPLGSELRSNINRRLNARINNAGALPGEGYRLMENFDFLVTAGGRTMTATISFPEVFSSGDNPVTNGQSFQEGTKQQLSAHSAMVADQAIGARTFAGKVLGKAQAFKDAALGTGGVERLTAGVYDDGGVWRMMTNVPAKDRSYDLWSAPLPAEVERSGLAYDAMVGFRRPIDTGDSERWSEQQKAQYADRKREILSALNLPQSMDGLVDGWVRQITGRPDGMMLDGRKVEPLSGKAALEAARDIVDNVSQGLSPVFGGFAPVLHVHDLKMLFRANRDAAHPWEMKGGLDPEARAAARGDWDDWVDVALGSALASSRAFDMYYLLPTDGFMHTYQNATRDLTELPISLNVLVNNQVLRMETSELTEGVAHAEMVQSIDPRTDRLVSNRVVLDTARAQLADLLGGQRIAGEFRGDPPPASERARQIAHLKRHRKETGMPVPVLKSMKDFRKNSTELVHHTTTTNALVRGLINLRVGMALFNPALYVSMPIEQGIRGSLDRVANLLVGQSTTGGTAKALAGTTERLQGTATGAVLGALGLEYNYTPDQLRQLNELYRVLATSPEFKSMIYGDLNYQRPYEPGSGRVSHALENFAKTGSKLQDPTYGMRDTTIARRYVEPALQEIIRQGTNTGLSVDMLIDSLHRNPLFLQRNYPEVHQAATNSLAQIRSLKQTPLSLALRWVYEPLSRNGNSAAANAFGNLVLRLPMIFSTYAGNVATTLLGLQGLSDMTAMFLDGRSKGPNSIFGRIAAKMEGREFTPEEDANFDMSSVLEGIDLSRSFLRGSLTHTGLFTFALMAGGLGLSGEDEEAKRRRRAAEYQGAGMVYDPRKIENDFRNADSIYLDWLPFGIDSYFKVTGDDRAMANVHWMLRQFISPIIGIEKFVETGNFQHVKWGFMDALGAFPLINSNTVTDTLETMALFEKQAADLALEGTDEANVKAAGLLTSVVGGYERMLFENSFLSALYTGMDEWDRDPYAEVMIDSDGEIQRDAMGNPRQSESLEPYVDEDGNTRSGYQSRSENEIGLAVLTENRPMMALMSSLFTGLEDSEYWRYNMVPKVREMEKPDTSMADARAVLRAAFIGLNAKAGASAQRELTEDEVFYMLKDQHEASGGGWIDYDTTIRPLAKELAAKSRLAPMSTIGPDGREHVTIEGAKGILRGLRKGELELGSEALRGVYITHPMREQLQDEMMEELVAEGVALGLSESSAVFRMKRLWYGPEGDSNAIGMADLLWKKPEEGGLSYSDNQKYYQLNTTYVMGPDGRPWATGFKRDGAPGIAGWAGGVLGAAGVLPLQRQHGAGSGAMGLDNLHNSVDLTTQQNTGLRGLVPMPEMVPTDVEIGKSIEEAIARAAAKDYSEAAPAAKRASGGYGGSGWRNFGGYGGYRRRSYGGGGYSSSGYPNFSRMYTLPEGRTPYGNDAPFINTSNPILRRGDVRRERVWSERGRLNQWQ